VIGVAERFDAIKLILAVVGGIGAVIALTIAYRKQRHSEAAEYREDTKLYTDRFGKAADQLGSDKGAVRLAGVYALAELADDWIDGRQVCIDVLCAYLRTLSTPQGPDVAAKTPQRTSRRYDAIAKLGWRRATEPTTPAPTRDPREEREVRQSVIRLISSRLRANARADWRGYDFDFTGAVFDSGGNFFRAQFPGGNVTFVGAQFTGGDFSFSQAQFSGGTVDFVGAQFTGGTADFANAQFTGGVVNFGGVQFSGGDVSFVRAHFADASVNFGAAQFTSSAVSFVEAQFANDTVNFHGANFTGGEVSFDGAQFTSGEVSFEWAQFLGGEVSFREVQFADGTVDISSPSAYRCPPKFDDWPDGPPAGLRLPANSEGLRN
jgi:uncharacterized protein YjbI with pentapeptide repeats